jgi:hypothetical protein
MMRSAVFRAQKPKLNRTGAKYVCDGNRQTQGINGASNSYPGRLAVMLGASVTNYGVGGQDISNMLTDAGTQIDNALSAALNILCVGEVRNELVNRGAAANARIAVDKLWQYCDGRRASVAAAGKQLRIVVWNILPCTRTSSPFGVAGLKVLFDESNAYIRNEWREHADSYVDVRSDSRLSDADDGAYFDDQVHLTNAGDAILARMMYSAIVALR